MSNLIKEVGSVAGLASFFGLALLAFLYFAQARHVRDLEDKATFVPEGLDLTEPVSEPLPAEADEEEEVEEAEPATATQAKAAKPAAPPRSAPEAEAARRVEAARAKADRRARFEQRRRTPGGRAAPPRAAAAGGRRMPEPRAMIVIGLGVVVLVAGIVFAAGKLLGGNDNGSSSGGAASSADVSSGPPPEVAVLNGTPVPGLAAKVGQDVRSAGFKLGNVTNTETPFTVTEVMFDQGGQPDATQVAAKLQIADVKPMSSDIKKVAGGSAVAIVVGEDRAGT